MVGSHTFNVVVGGDDNARIRLNDTDNTFSNETISLTVVVANQEGGYALSGNSATFYVSIVGGKGENGVNESAYSGRDTAAIAATLKVQAQ